MGVKESAIFSALMLILVSSTVSSVIVSENWAVTQLEELTLKYKWMINNFELITLKEDEIINSPMFWPPGNESFKWEFELFPRKTSMSLYLYSYSDDKVHVNYTLTVGGKKLNNTKTLKKFESITWLIIDYNDIFENYLPNGTLTIYCEIHSIYKIIESSGTKLDQCTSMQAKSVESKLSNNLLTLLENEKFSDITIIIEDFILDKEIRAHKNILAARSPVFASLLLETMSSNENSSFIEIKDVQPKVFEKLLKYIYTDEIDKIDETLAKELIVAAIKYDVKGLVAKCEEILCSIVNVDNAIEIFEIADQHNISQLKSQALKFVADHAPTVINSNEFIAKELKQSKSRSMYDIFRTLAYKSINP